MSSDTVDESKYELSPNASPEWTGLLNYTDYDVDSEVDIIVAFCNNTLRGSTIISYDVSPWHQCIIGSLFSIEA